MSVRVRKFPLNANGTKKEILYVYNHIRGQTTDKTGSTGPPTNDRQVSYLIIERRTV